MALSPAETFQAELERRRRLPTAARPGLDKGLAKQLVPAADQFIIAPLERVAEKTRMRATGGDVRTVIAGYHWFTDWGRGHHDQPRRPDLDDRTAYRGGSYSAYFCPLPA